MMKPLRAALCAALALGLFACSQAQLDQAATTADSAAAQIQQAAVAVSPALTAACTDAMSLAGVAALVPQAAPILPFVTAGCGTAEGLAKLAADPSSVEWVGTLVGQLKAVVPLQG